MAGAGFSFAALKFWAVLLFGREMPGFVLGAAVVALVVFGLLINRSMPARVGWSGTGPIHQCARCGRKFQVERVEKMSDGSEHRFLDNVCPGCGWDEDNEPHPRFG